MTQGKEPERDRPFYCYLPELYRKDPVLDRLVGILEQMYVGIEGEIRELPNLLYNFRTAPEWFLNSLGLLVGLENEEGLFTAAQMRVLIPAARRLQQRKGTRCALEELLSFYLDSLCGHPVKFNVLEYENLPVQEHGSYSRLYRGEYDFTVLIGPEPLLQSAEEQARLEMLVREYSPAFAIPHVVAMKTQTWLGDLDYLGYSTWL